MLLWFNSFECFNENCILPKTFYTLQKNYEGLTNRNFSVIKMKVRVILSRYNIRPTKHINIYFFFFKISAIEFNYMFLTKIKLVNIPFESYRRRILLLIICRCFWVTLAETRWMYDECCKRPWWTVQVPQTCNIMSLFKNIRVAVNKSEPQTDQFYYLFRLLYMTYFASHINITSRNKVVSLCQG